MYVCVCVCIYIYIYICIYVYIYMFLFKTLRPQVSLSHGEEIETSESHTLSGPGEGHVQGHRGKDCRGKGGGITDPVAAQ
jgi:hypothetical protein